MQVTTHSGRTFSSGTMTGTSQIIPMDGAPMPTTITLKSSDGTRKIELSVDGGTEYFIPPYATSTSTMLVVTLGAPVSHVKFTGVATNTWSIR